MPDAGGGGPSGGMPTSEGIKCPASTRFSPDQEALVDLAKQSSSRGLTVEEGKMLKVWANEVNVPFRGPEAHPGEGFGSQEHFHIGPIDHILLRK